MLYTLHVVLLKAGYFAGLFPAPLGPWQDMQAGIPFVGFPPLYNFSPETFISLTEETLTGIFE